MEEGLVEEVRSLKEHGYDRSLVSMQGLGYKEILAYLDGEITLEEAVYILKRDTRHFAKRQLTWFKRTGSAVDRSSHNMTRKRGYTDRYDTYPSPKGIIDGSCII